jgi:prepilin peptidase dependent protein B
MHSHRNCQTGMTLVELMVGLAIGLFISATALTLMLNQLRDDRLLLQQSRLSADLQAAADLVAHDLRRAGFRKQAESAIASVAPDADPAALANPYASIDWPAADGALALAYQPADPTDGDQFRFRLVDGTLKMKIAGGSYQPVTDPSAIVLTRFSVSPVTEELDLGDFCERACPATDAGCPRQFIRRFDLVLAARSTADPSLTRELHTSVRVRNDLVTGQCPV